LSHRDELDYTDHSAGGHLDQRLDRLLHTQEVVGSNPTVPTINSLAIPQVFQNSHIASAVVTRQFPATFDLHPWRLLASFFPAGF
jgi:hypothetical protein